MSCILKVNYLIIFVILIFLSPVYLSGQEAGGGEAAEPEENPVYFQSFSQKGGMLPKGSHSVYLRTNDEFTGFSTLFAGYRYAVSDWFQFAIEGGVGINVYLGSFLTYWKFFESESRKTFIGLRTRTGYKYQDSHIQLNNALLDDERNGFYLAADLTLAWRPGKQRRLTLYYSFYPFFDVDITGKPVEIYLAPVHLGIEFIFKRNPRWSFAYETGYFFAVNDVPETSWFNFPNLGNLGFYYRTGRKYAE